MNTPIHEPVAAVEASPRIISVTPQPPKGYGPIPASMNEKDLLALANLFAPVIHFHQEEPFLPCTVEWYLNKCQLHGPNGFSVRPTRIADLPEGYTDDGNYWLEVDESAKAGTLKDTNPGDPDYPEAYVHAEYQVAAPYVDLQYWIFFGYNGPGTLQIEVNGTADNFDLAPVGEHWSDWEMVVVRLNQSTGEPVAVFLSQHGEGVWYQGDLLAEKLQRNGNSLQYVVYSSKNGHAMYPGIGMNPTNSGSFDDVSYLLRNDTDDRGSVFNTAGHLSIVSSNFSPDVAEAKWLRFPDRWGKGVPASLPESTTNNIIEKVHPTDGFISGFENQFLKQVVSMISDAFPIDNTDGVHGPMTQSYWWSIPLIPNNGYTGYNTNPYCPPAIASFNNLFHVFFKDHGGNGVMHLTSADGIQWTRPNSFYTGVNTSSGPRPVVYMGTLYVFFRDGSGNGILHIQSKDGDTWSAAPNWYIGQNCDGEPSAAVLNGTLCVVSVDHGGNGIMRAVQNAVDGPWNLGYTGYNTSAPPCIVAYKGLFHVFFMDHGGKGIMHLTSPDGIYWKPSESWYTGNTTSAGPAAVVYGDACYIFFRDGSGNGILSLESINGVTWRPTANSYFGLNGDGQPSVAVKSDKTGLCVVCVDANGKNGIMRSVLTPELFAL